MKETDDSKKEKGGLQQAWGNPVGKAVIITAGTLTIIGLAGFSLKILAFSVNGYKDFKSALKR